MQLEDKKFQKAMLSLLIHSDSEEALRAIQTSDSSPSNSSDEEIALYPKNYSVTTKSQELLFEII